MVITTENRMAPIPGFDPDVVPQRLFYWLNKPEE